MHGHILSTHTRVVGASRAPGGVSRLVALGGVRRLVARGGVARLVVIGAVVGFTPDE